jgi:uncharacterized phage-associated protein
MTHAFDIAGDFVRRSFDTSDSDESDPLTPLRLQKLLYYAQGWSLALLGKPLFQEPIEAWRKGPVVPQIYHRLWQHKADVIPRSEFKDAVPLSPIQSAIVELVWKEYARHSAHGLTEMTHRERPWLEARGELPDDARSNNVIDPGSMEAFFYEIAKKMGGDIDPRDIWKGEEQYLSGDRLLSAEEVFAE